MTTMAAAPSMLPCGCRVLLDDDRTLLRGTFRLLINANRVITSAARPTDALLAVDHGRNDRPDSKQRHPEPSLHELLDETCSPAT